MDGLTPVQISELVTLLEDAISTRSVRLENAPNREGESGHAGLKNQIDHLEAELAWIQWMRENHLDHEENGFPAPAVEEHIRGMREGIERWRARLQEGGPGADKNYIQSLENSIEIVGSILELFVRVRRIH
jgi:hypothetical protein